jgi:hypothetical protein
MVASAPQYYKQVRFVNSVPDIQMLGDREIVIVGSMKRAKWAVLQCPCGCGHPLHVDLMETHYPHWRISFHSKNVVSLLPSLWVKDAPCRSHFFIRCNRVTWATSDDTTAER